MAVQVFAGVSLFGIVPIQQLFYRRCGNRNATQTLDSQGNFNMTVAQSEPQLIYRSIKLSVDGLIRLFRLHGNLIRVYHGTKNRSAVVQRRLKLRGA